MNHPGIIFALLWLLVLSVSPFLPVHRVSDPGSGTLEYVCPPCGCEGHDRVYGQPGRCEFCNMPLIKNTFPRVKLIEWGLYREDLFAFFHHKLFYPAYFLTILLGLLSIWRNKRDQQTIFFLAFFLIYIVYAFKSQLAGTEHSMHFSRRWFFFPGTFLLAAGPALWYYTRSYGVRSPSFGRRDALHFLPAILVFTISSLLFLGPSSWRELALYNSFDHYPAWAEQLVFLLSGTYYGWRTNQWVSRRKTLPAKVVAWFKGVLAAHFLLIGLWGLMLSANYFLYNNMSTSLEYHFIWLFTALLALVGAYMIIFRKELVFPEAACRDQRLEQRELELYKKRLLSLMQYEKPYLDPELNLQRLAVLLGIREKELSELLNSGLETNFYQFVNTYRLEEVRKLLLDPEKQHLTNLAIAQEAGFASRSSFFNLFKKHFGTTPGAFKKAHVNSR